MDSSRTNNSSRVDVYDKIVGEGSFKVVKEGKYTVGERVGQKAVVKELRSGNTWEASVFEKELEVVAKAASIIQDFNSLAHIDKPIVLNRPEVWEYDDAEGSRRKGCVGAKVLVEPFVEKFEKFNSNTGWTPGVQTPWDKVMQALSHYSYHWSSGQFLLCDLQGGVYMKKVVLTDPVVQSRDQRYGATDLGPQGIEQFFHQHQCNQYCNHAWQQPRGTKSHFPVRSGTSMVGRNGQWLVPTLHSRAPYTHAQY